jgi:serine/threonine-protein kinase
LTTIQNPKIGGRYQILTRLGNGGFGTTFLAQDMQRPGNPHCVVKQLTLPSTDPIIFRAAKRLFDEEAATLEMLGSHNQIPLLLAHIEENQEFYLVEEYIEGHDITEELPYGVSLSEEVVTQMLCQILEVLAFVHQNDYVHRDIKPANLRRRDSDGKIVLLDFGAVKQICNQTINLQGQVVSTVVVGTPGYMPGEQAQGCPHFSSDIYAVGAIAIEALTGIKPQNFQLNNKGEIIWRDKAAVSNNFGNIIDIMVRYDYRQRYQSASEALQAISKTSQHSLRRKISKILAVAGIGGFLILTVTIGNFLWQTFKPVPENFIDYENNTQGVKIKYPDNWKIRETPNAITQELVSFVSPKQEQDNFSEVVTISVENFSGTLDESVKVFSEEISNNVEDLQILDNSETTLTKKPARQLVFTSKVGEHNLKSLQAWILKGNKAYIVTYAADIADYDRFVRTAEKMIASFEIN